MTIHRYQRPHQILVGQSQSPNTKTATQSPSQPVTLSSQDTLRMTNPLVATESTTASVGETEFDRKKRHIEIKTFLSELPSGPIGYSGRFALAPAQTRVAAGPTPRNRELEK